MKRKISFIFGTRPEAIKLCPLILAMTNQAYFEPKVCVTGQHREMLDQILADFKVTPDTDLGLMQPNQSLSSLTARAITAVSGYLQDEKPDCIMVQGDTTTVFCAALSAFYHKIPVGHIEAGLRTWNNLSPFPEEINRVLTTRIAEYHFAPTEWAKNNLLKEGIAEKRVFVTGNTVIDALHIAVNKVRKNPPMIPGLPNDLIVKGNKRPVILITGHRRENFGKGFLSICKAISSLAGSFTNIAFVYPVHLNPNVREPVFDILKGHKNIFLIDPLSYLPFISLMDRAFIILTDSGGVQEEAPTLGKPVLVLRDTTERPEAVQAGTVKVVGTDPDKIVSETEALLKNPEIYQTMSKAHNPYGDGKACDRIIKILKREIL